MAKKNQDIVNAVKEALRGEDKENHIPVPEKPQSVNDYLNEQVEVRLFKDNDRYKNDMFVGVNGYTYQIKRGIPVMVPRYVADIIWESQRQETIIANRQDELINQFADASKKYGITM